MFYKRLILSRPRNAVVSKDAAVSSAAGLACFDTALRAGSA